MSAIRRVRRRLLTLGAAVLVTVTLVACDGGDVEDPGLPAEVSSTVHLLDRAAATSDDRVLRVVLGPDGFGGTETVFAAPRILAFDVGGGTLAVLTEAEDGTQQVAVTSDADGLYALPLPGAGAVDLLQVSEAGRVGLRLTAADPHSDAQSSAQAVHLAEDGVLEPLILPDGASVAGEWCFIPGSDDILFLEDGALFRWTPGGAEAPREILPPDAEPGAAGGHDGHEGGDDAHDGHDHGWERIEDMTTDGSRVALRSQHETAIVDLVDGAEEVVTAAMVGGVVPFGGQVAILPGGAGWVQKVSVVDPESGRYSTRVVLEGGSGSTVLVNSEGTDLGIDDIRVSPDGRTLAVEVVPSLATGDPDGYYPFARSVTIMTVVVDLASGTEVDRIEGFGLRW